MVKRMLIALKTDPFSNTTLASLASLARQFGDEKQCGTTCLYGPSDYTTTNSHPPVVGFSYDGHLIYGRYLDSSAPGYAAPLLDACGGHEHDTAGTDEYGISLQNYHYHTQIFDAEVESGQTAESGEAYVASTPGPFQCFKADLSSSSGSSALLKATASSSYAAKNSMNYRCCGMTQYYLYNGVSTADTVTTSLSNTSFCTVPSDPTNGAYSTYTAGERACTAGDRIYSGNACIPDCDDGYKVSGMTRCVGGSITETATCITATSSPTSRPTTSSFTCYDDDYIYESSNDDGDDLFSSDDDETVVSRTGIMILAGIGVLIICGCGTGAFFFFRARHRAHEAAQSGTEMSRTPKRRAGGTDTSEVVVDVI